MPKANKRKVSPKPDNIVLSKKTKPRGRARSKQNLTPDAQRSHPAGYIVQPVYETFNDRGRSDPSPSDQTGLSVGGHAKSFKPSTQVHNNGKHTHHNRPPEIQELRGRPEAVATVTAENFKRMSEDLQSNLRRVFQDLNNGMGQASALVDPNFLEASAQLHGRSTRATAQHSNQFFKTLIPKDKVPAEDGHIKVQFQGTNTIKTHAPGYTETITFGNGRWSRTRNGVTESGGLDDEESARLAEQTRQMSDGLMQHATRSLAGMLRPENTSGLHSPPSSIRGPSLPNGIVAPRSSTASIPPMRGKRGNRGALRGRGRF